MKTKVLKRSFSILCVLMFAVCLLNSNRVSSESVYYLKLCAFNVIPSLFVFSVLCAVICSSRYFYKLCALPLFGTEAAVLILGLLGGFPLGASIATQLFESGSISKKQAEYLCSFSNNPSISFVISYTGSVVGSKATGIKLFLITALSSALIGVIMKYVYLSKNERYFKPRFIISENSLANSIKESCVTMITVSGCIVFFGSISVFFPSFLRGFFEVSGGISACRTPVEAAILLGFSGFSVMLQVAAVCENKLSVMPFIISKLAQSAIMGTFAYFLFD